MIEKRTVAEVLNEPPPSTVIYRTETNERATVKSLLDVNVDSLTGALKERDPDEIETGQQNGKSYIRSDRSKKAKGSAPEKLSTFNGVFVPCLLNIWGVIMFLRLGWVVGQAGIFLAICIIVASNVVTTITALSMSAICTNGEIKGGGAYFLISRALGPVYGGTIGILFFAAQAVATSLYVVGFAETIAIDLFDDLGVDSFTGNTTNDIRVIGIVVSILLLMVALVGVGWYAKAQIGLLVILLIAMCSVLFGSFFPGIPNVEQNALDGFVGYGVRNLGAHFQPTPENPGAEVTFFGVFAVFFPAVTGIMAGANLSGDLKDPSISIPKGTLWAIFATFWSYILLTLILGFTCVACVEQDGGCLYNTENRTGDGPFGGLLFNKLIMRNISLWAPLVYVGVFAATLSSALASLVGAPRILQSVARDELFPISAVTYFGKGHGRGDEPVRAYFLTFVINCCCVLIGNLNQIAPLISNFFMISYLFTNYACFASSQTDSPAWRPAFKYYNKWLSGLGALLCFVIMFLLDWITALVTFAVGVCIYFYLLRLDPEVNWGAAGEAKKYVIALKSLEKLQLANDTHVKTFRPSLLVLTGPLRERQWLIKFASLLQKGRGLMICGDIVLPIDKDEEGKSISSVDQVDSPIHTETAHELALAYEMVSTRRVEGDEFLSDKTVWRKRCPGAFCEAVSAETVYEGFQRLLQTSGLGKMRPNTVVIGFKKRWRNCGLGEIADYERLIRTALASNVGVMIVRDDYGVFDSNFKGIASSKIRSCWPIYGRNRKRKENDPKKEDAAVTQSTNSMQKIVPHIKGDRIDVWWLVDDGGLTMLMAHLLNQSRAFRRHKLRVMTITDYSTDESVKLKRTEIRMIHLLTKFRIRAQTTGVQANLHTNPTAETIGKFESLGLSLNDLSKAEREKTLYYLRLAELVRFRSLDASIVFIVLPIPETGLRVSLYMRWLHMISDSMPPTVLMRGNNENVLTLFC